MTKISFNMYSIWRDKIDVERSISWRIMRLYVKRGRQVFFPKKILITYSEHFSSSNETKKKINVTFGNMRGEHKMWHNQIRMLYTEPASGHDDLENRSENADKLL